MKGKKLQLLFLKSKKLMIAAALLALFVVGETFAWVNLGLSIDNKLEAHTTEVEIKEFFPPTENSSEVTKQVSFTNNGSSDVFIRISYDEYWEYVESGNRYVLPNKISNGTTYVDVATKEFTEDFKNPNLWFNAGDGWYYYKRVLKSGNGTSDILNQVTFPIYSGAYEKYKDATYHLYFTVEAVQASTGVGTLNSDEVNEKATEEVFGRAITTVVKDEKTGNFIVTWTGEGGSGS